MLQTYIKNNRLRIGVALLALLLIPAIVWVANPTPDNAASTTQQGIGQQVMAPAGGMPTGSSGSSASSGVLPHQYPNGVISGVSVKNDVSPPLRDIPPAPI